LRSQIATSKTAKQYLTTCKGRVVAENKSLVPLEKIEQNIVVIRNIRVILDSDLARLYGASTKRLNEQVRRNINRFPEDFMF